MANDNSPNYESDKDNSSDEHKEEKDDSFTESKEDNSFDEHKEEEDNSFDEHKEEKDNSFTESKEEKDNSSGEREKDSSFDELEEEEDNSSDEWEGGNNKKRKSTVIKKRGKKTKISPEEDDSEETLQKLLLEHKNGDSDSPPLQILKWIYHLVMDLDLPHYSKCIYKQLTKSDVDVNQNRLMLGKQEVRDKFLCLLRESEIPGVEGVDVLVYGPDGKSHEMKFKIWIKNTPVLANGWINFVEAYGLKKYSDVLQIWMFRRRQDNKICFAIHSNSFDGITKQLSKRIFKRVFQN